MTELIPLPNALVVQTQATSVTFFEDRAEVVRQGRCTVPQGSSLLQIPGVSLVVDDATVLARLKGTEARCVASRVVRQVRTQSVLSPKEIEQLEEQYEQAQKRTRKAQLTLEAAQNQKSQLQMLYDRWLRALCRVPATSDEELSRWEKSHEGLEQALALVLEDEAAQQKELSLAQLEQRRTAERLHAARRYEPRYETALELQIESSMAQELELQVVYRTACALWRPEHLVQLVTGPADSGHKLRLRTWATVWQCTGEDWSQIKCRFSTARPAHSASAPLLVDDVLVSRKKTDAERQTVHVESRDQRVQTAGLDRGTRTVDEMPGVEDGGEPLWWEAPSVTSVPSDGQPVRIDLFENTVECTVDRIAYPEQSEAVHLRATATLSTAQPMLAGPVWLVRQNQLVGRSRIDFLPRGEPFEIGLGPDDSLRVHRAVDETRETTAVLSRQKITRTVRLYVSNLSGEPKKLTVTERFPVSELEEVQVEVLGSQGAKLDKRDGFAHYGLELAPQGTQALSLTYRLEASSKVVLSL